MKSNFHNRIYNYEVGPPAETWKKISDTLDETEQANSFSSKLYHFETTPTVSAWEKIQTSLDTIHEADAPPKKTFPIFFRYAAASIIIGLITWAIINFFNNSSGRKEMAKEKNTIQSSDLAESSKNDSIKATEQNRDDEALEESKHTLAKIDLPIIRPLDKYRNVPAKLISDVFDHSTEKINYQNGLESSAAHDEADGNTADRYIMLMTPDGNMVRMSKKWADMVCCVSSADQDADCKDQLQKWREQIACSTLAPSSGNFMDILSLVSSLQDN